MLLSIHGKIQMNNVCLEHCLTELCIAPRAESRSEIKQVLNTTNSMSDLRANAIKIPNLKIAWLESFMLKELPGTRTSRLCLEGSIQAYIDQTVVKGKYQQQHMKSVLHAFYWHLNVNDYTECHSLLRILKYQIIQY